MKVEALLRTLARTPDVAEILGYVDRDVALYLRSRPEAGQAMAELRAFWRVVKEVYES